MSYVDPAVRTFLDKLASAPPPPADLAEQRAGFSALWRSMAPAAPADAVCEARQITQGECSVECLVYRPQGLPDGAPAVIFYHGGGGVMLSPEDFDATSRMIADEARCLVVAPRYRQAPEHPFPAPVDDCLAVYRWASADIDSWGADPARIALMGDSAGGYLAATVTQDAKRLALPMPVAQILIYPMLDMAGAGPSRFDRAAFVTHENLTATIALHFGDHVLDPRASPLRAADVGGLPQCLMIAVDTDPLYDEARAYTHRLRAAGVPVSFFCYEGQVHGFFSFGGAMPQGNLCVTHVAGWLRHAFGAGT